MFAPGETVKTVEVEIIDDDDEDSGEVLALLLAGASGATLGDAWGAGSSTTTRC